MKHRLLPSSPKKHLKCTRAGSLSKPPASWNHTSGTSFPKWERHTQTHTHNPCNDPCDDPCRSFWKGGRRKFHLLVHLISEGWKSADSIQEGKALSLHSRQRQTKQTVSFLSYSSQIPGSFFSTRLTVNCGEIFHYFKRRRPAAGANLNPCRDDNTVIQEFIQRRVHNFCSITRAVIVGRPLISFGRRALADQTRDRLRRNVMGLLTPTTCQETTTRHLWREKTAK